MTRALRPDLPTRLDALICVLLAKDPARRPASAQDVAEALGQALRELRGEIGPLADDGAREERSVEERVAEIPAATYEPRDSADSDERVTLDLPPSS